MKSPSEKPSSQITTQHTPSPWKFWQSEFANSPFLIYAGNSTPTLDKDGQPDLHGSQYIARSPDSEGPDHEECLANARLIAAAPDLLEALNAMKKVYGADTIEPMWSSERLFKLAQSAHEKLKAAIACAEGRS